MRKILKISLSVAFLWAAIPAGAYELRPYIIAVAGGSASGKSLVARKITEALGPERTTLVSADNYYAPDKQPCQFYLNDSINYDHPSAIDLDKLASHLAVLRAGLSVRVKEHDFGQLTKEKTFVTYQPKQFIVVEGIYVLDPRIAAAVDLRIFIDVDQETRLKRRIQRDYAERGYGEAEVREYFNSAVQPMHQRYVQPSSLRADLIIESPDDPAKLLSIVEIASDQAKEMHRIKSAIMQDAYDQAITSIQTANPGRYRLLKLDDLFIRPRVPLMGVGVSQMSAAFDKMVHHAALNPDDPRPLVEYLEAHSISVVVEGERPLVIDQYSLILALYKKGIRRVLVGSPSGRQIEAARRVGFLNEKDFGLASVLFKGF